MGGVPRYWRLQQHSYTLTGQVCTRCGTKRLSPRESCETCSPAAGEALAYAIIHDARLARADAGTDSTYVVLPIRLPRSDVVLLRTRE